MEILKDPIDLLYAPMPLYVTLAIAVAFFSILASSNRPMEGQVAKRFRRVLMLVWFPLVIYQVVLVGILVLGLVVHNPVYATTTSIHEKDVIGGEIKILLVHLIDFLPLGVIVLGTPISSFSCLCGFSPD